jgi:hypothetical protein
VKPDGMQPNPGYFCFHGATLCGIGNNFDNYFASFAGLYNSLKKSSMNRLSRYLFLVSLVFLISLGIFVGSIYQRETQNFTLLNASSLRLLTFTGLSLFTVISFGAAFVTWKKPLWGQYTLSVIERLIEQNWVYETLFVFRYRQSYL